MEIREAMPLVSLAAESVFMPLRYILLRSFLFTKGLVGFSLFLGCQCD